MKKVILFLIAIMVITASSALYADYLFSDMGTWSANWPKELEPLRKQATTYIGPMIDAEHHAIPFKEREEFEKAWPHLLKVKSKGAPIILVRRGFAVDFFKVIPAGVVIHSPPARINRKVNPEEPISGIPDTNARERWMNTTFIELVVDGQVVDLNRILLPADTPIIDKRFQEPESGKSKSTPPVAEQKR